MTDKIPNDAALRSRVADLLHLLQFARIETPTAGDAEHAEKAMNDLDRMLAAPVAQEQVALPDGITISKDFFGTVHIKLGDFDFIQIKYDHRYTYNSHQEWVASRIVEAITAPPAAQQSAPAAPVAGLDQDSYIDDLLDRMNDAQQEINLAANTTMSQALCAAAALLDEVEVALKRCSTSPAAQQPDTVAVPRELYTCVGKGGEYELLGRSLGAGERRLDRVVVYRDTETGLLYHRTLDDFDARMALLGKEDEA